MSSPRAKGKYQFNGCHEQIIKNRNGERKKKDIVCMHLRLNIYIYIYIYIYIQAFSIYYFLKKINYKNIITTIAAAGVVVVVVVVVEKTKVINLI